MPELIASLIWRPYFPPVAVLLAGAVLAVLALVVCWRTWVGRPGVSLGMLAVRLGVIAALVTLLMGPSNLPPVSESPARPTLTVMLDTSGSMQTPDMTEKPRYNFARQYWLSDEQIANLGEAFDIDLVTFDAQPRAGDLARLAVEAESAATARHTNVPESVQQTVAALPVGADGSALLLLSDGRDSDDASYQAAALLAKQRSVPVHTVTLGGSSLTRDLALYTTLAQPYLLAGEPGRLDVRVLQANADESQTTIHLRCNGEEQTHAVAFDGRREVALDLRIEQDEPGIYEYEVWCEPVTGELELANNRQTVFVEVTAARFKVLLIEGQPYWDTKFIAQSLRKDRRVELTQITQVTPDRQEIVVSRADPTDARLPATLEEFARYDVVILGGSMENILSPGVASLLPRYVSEQGGRLVFARGRAYDAGSPAGRPIGRELSVLEPVVWGQGLDAFNAELAVAPAALSHPALSFLSEQADGSEQALEAMLPRLRRVPAIEREKESALVLARARPRGQAGSGQPVIVTMPYPSGRVVAVVGEGLWQWSMLARRNPDLAGVYDRFWSNMIRWLAMGSDYRPGQDLSLRLSSRGLQLGDELRAEIISRTPSMLDGATLELLDPSGNTLPIGLSGEGGLRKNALIRPEQTGVYTLRLKPSLGNANGSASIQAKFTVQDINLERLESAADPRSLRMLAEQTGGQVLSPYEPEQLGGVLERYLAMMTIPPQPTYIWDRGIFLFLLLLLAGSEWIGRKLGGML
ncbi:MAG: hypothetical protein AAGC44_00565 [Planctomycetota bacterium]